MAKLSGIRKALIAAMKENVSRHRRGAGEIRTRATFPPDHVQHYFTQAAGHLETLKGLLPDLYNDFQPIKTEPETEMAPDASDRPAAKHFSRSQTERLVRDIDQIFEVRANSELEQPKQKAVRCLFISHGRSNDWRVVQPYIEKDVGLPTIELAQEANMGGRLLKS